MTHVITLCVEQGHSPLVEPDSAHDELVANVARVSEHYGVRRQKQLRHYL